MQDQPQNPHEFVPDPDLRAARDEIRAVAAGLRAALAADDQAATGEQAVSDDQAATGEQTVSGERAERAR
ncbi:hypothetical protein [Kribbella sp. HUAS MG21]|uniref:Uncharacterized protein n=1 Tax=Kribbella sp. HUAS MG21 TaxID=3160966 RepID=A0AAU7TMF0_9ACTN